MNDDSRTTSRSTLKPAYHQAERNLLAIMMHDPEIASYVEVKLGDAFNVSSHAALAAYVYAWYSEHEQPDISRFIGMLDPDLGSMAAAVALLYTKETSTMDVVDDYIREIRKVPLQRTIEQRKKAMLDAERAGDLVLATSIGSEIISLERQIKLTQQGVPGRRELDNG